MAHTPHPAASSATPAEALAPRATWREWIQGARPRTLGVGVAPVLVGTALGAAAAGEVRWGRAVLAGVVALALQIGVNYANDYSDGVRGTDARRTGPVRLTASGLAAPAAVRVAAAVAFAVAAVAGAVLCLVVEPWLLVFGVAALAAAILYTGGPRPYGYIGLGEVMVLAFFGVGATAGSAYAQVGRVPASAWSASFVVGFLACAVLLVNNLRDIPTDTVAGKRTLAVRLGAARTRGVFVALVVGALVMVVPVGLSERGAFLAFGAAPLAVVPVWLVLRRRDPPSLVRALVATARLEVVAAVLMTLGVWVWS
jgi:1,4-dihydroxy-2-naphthoate octaprenyltransferase